MQQPVSHSRAVRGLRAASTTHRRELVSRGPTLPATNTLLGSLQQRGNNCSNQLWHCLQGREHIRPAATGIDTAPVAAGPVTDMSGSLCLDNIRSALIRMEDSIIFSLIERAQFSRNQPVYTPGAIPVPAFDENGHQYSYLQYVLRGTEQWEGSLRRFTSPDEHPFFPESKAVPLVLPPIQYPPVLAAFADSININNQIMHVYLEDVLPGIAAEGDDNNYGSAVTLDVRCLQALSKRIHYGKFVAEAKFRKQTEEYTQLIKAGDADGIMELLTDKKVEKMVIERVRLKAATFGQDIAAPSASGHAANGNGQAPRYKVSPDVVAALYDQWVMPLTKEVEVQYLLKRA